MKHIGRRYDSGQEPHERPAGLLVRILGHPVWAGLAVIIPTAAAFVIYFLSTSAPPSTPIHGTSPATPSATPVASKSSVLPPGTQQPSPASSGTYLVQRTPLQAGAYGVTDGPVQIGRHTYPRSVSFPCGQGAAEVQSVIYNVVGFSHLRATIGIPNNSPPTTGNAANVVLYKNESSTTLGSPILVGLGRKQPIYVNLHNAVRLTISCFGSGGTIALGDAVLTSP
jgi:hypothetical protein